MNQGPRFPVRVVLTELAEALSEREQPLLAWVAGSISRRVGSTISTELFRRWLGRIRGFSCSTASTRCRPVLGAIG